MYYFRFKKHKYIEHSMETYNVYEAVKYLNEIHKDQQKQEKTIKLGYEIVESDNKNEAIISDVIILGNDSYFDYFQYTTNRFRQIFADDEETLAKLSQLIKSLEKQYDEELLEKYDLPNEESVHDDLINPPPVTDNTVYENQESKEGKRKLDISKLTNFIPFAIAGLLLIYGIHGFLSQSTSKPQAVQEREVTAVDKSDENLSIDELEKVEREIFLKGEEGIQELKNLSKEYPEFRPAQFDLAYLEQDYSEVIKMREIADNDPRKAQLAIAYIQTGQLDKATQINNQLKNQEIDSLINDGYNKLAREALKNQAFKEARAYQELSGDEELGEVVKAAEDLQKELKQLDKEEDSDKFDEIENRLNELLENV